MVSVVAATTLGLVLIAQNATTAPAFGVSTLVGGGLGTNTVATGSILYGSGNATTIGALAGAATTGYFLQSLGTGSAPQWVGGMALLTTIAPSNVATCGDVSSLTSRYRYYRIEFDNLVPVTLTAVLSMTIATTGSAFTNAGYISGVSVSCNGTVALDTATTSFLLSGSRATTAISSSTVYGISGFIEIFNPSSTIIRKSIGGLVTYNTSGTLSTTTLAQASVYGIWDTSSNAVTGVQFAFSSGNIATGTIKIYGMS